jgi:hypothetical protein
MSIVCTAPNFRMLDRGFDRLAGKGFDTLAHTGFDRIVVCMDFAVIVGSKACFDHTIF